MVRQKIVNKITHSQCLRALKRGKRTLTQWIYRKNEQPSRKSCSKTCTCQANTDYEIQNSDLEIPEQTSTKIQNTVYQIRNLPKQIDPSMMPHFTLSWSHYIVLMRTTIGILLCKSKKDSLVELTLPKDANIYAAEYSLYLPDKKELQEKLQEWLEEFEE